LLTATTSGLSLSACFTAVCRSVALPPEQILYVGDDRRNDCEGASAAGLQAVLFDPREKHKAFSGRHCHRLAELLGSLLHSGGSQQ
jgi:putative hydrolase of the HAD superfamily